VYGCIYQSKIVPKQRDCGNVMSLPHGSVIELEARAKLRLPDGAFPPPQSLFLPYNGQWFYLCTFDDQVQSFVFVAFGARRK